MSKFLTPLDLRYIDGRNWLVMFPFVYQSDLIGQHRVGVGFVTDFNSQPEFLWSILPPTEFGEAALIHDDLYRSGIWDRLTADQVHREILRLSDAPAWKVKAYYAGLRLCGWITWRRYRKQEAHAAV